MENATAESLRDDEGELDGTWRDTYRNRRNFSPRMKLAAKLYGTGIAKTLGEASRLAGMSPATIYVMNSSGNEEFKRLIGEAERSRDIATGDISAVLQRLGRSGLAKIDQLREHAESEAVQLKAAIDLADRSPETSKIQRHAIASVSIEGHEVEKLTKALVEAAMVQQQYSAVHIGDFVKVSTDVGEPKALPTNRIASQAPLTFAEVKETDNGQR
jgi:hypothetical protein